MDTPYMTLFVPVESYARQLEQMIAIFYRVQEPSKAEPFQHELQSLVDYNHTTHSGYFPVYL